MAGSDNVVVVCAASPGSGVWIFVGGVAHGAELGHEEVVASVVGGRVLLDVCELHKLRKISKFSSFRFRLQIEVSIRFTFLTVKLNI